MLVRENQQSGLFLIPSAPCIDQIKRQTDVASSESYARMTKTPYPYIIVNSIYSLPILVIKSSSAKLPLWS